MKRAAKYQQLTIRAYLSLRIRRLFQAGSERFCARCALHGPVFSSSFRHPGTSPPVLHDWTRKPVRGRRELPRASWKSFRLGKLVNTLLRDAKILRNFRNSHEVRGKRIFHPSKLALSEFTLHDCHRSNTDGGKRIISRNLCRTHSRLTVSRVEVKGKGHIFISHCQNWALPSKVIQEIRLTSNRKVQKNLGDEVLDNNNPRFHYFSSLIGLIWKPKKSRSAREFRLPKQLTIHPNSGRVKTPHSFPEAEYQCPINVHVRLSARLSLLRRITIITNSTTDTKNTLFVITFVLVLTNGQSEFAIWSDDLDDAPSVIDLITEYLQLLQEDRHWVVNIGHCITSSSRVAGYSVAATLSRGSRHQCNYTYVTRSSLGTRCLVPPGCHAADVVISTRDHRPHRIKEVARVSTDHSHRHPKEVPMKTLAVRLDDETMDLLGVVSQLEGTSLVDQIRTAITTHLEAKVAGGELATRAQAAMEAIDSEAAARKAAIGSLVGQVAPASPPAGANGSRRRGAAKGE